MAHSSPLDRIRIDRIMSVARTGFGVGKVVADQVGKAATAGATKAAGVVTEYVGHRRRPAGPPPAPAPPPARTPAPPTAAPEPPAPAADTSAAVTSDVDAAASEVEATPADVAKRVAKKPRPPARASGSSRKPVKKSVPGGKLPPRKPAASVSPGKDADKG